MSFAPTNKLFILFQLIAKLVVKLTVGLASWIAVNMELDS